MYLRLTQEAFESIRPLMYRMSPERLQNAYAVLVEGLDCSEVASAAGVDYKIVHRAAMRVYERWIQHSKGTPQGWVQVTCLAPADVARAFLSDVEQARKLMGVPG
jgi:hypothetical protein